VKLALVSSRLLWWAMLPLLLQAAGAGAQANPAAEFELSPDAASPVLVLRQTPTELVGAPTRELRVFPDGRCEMDIPAPMREAGHYEWKVSPAEVQALARQAFDAGVPDLDPAALRASLKAAKRQDDALGQTYRFDDDIVEFELNVPRYRVDPGKAWSPLTRRVRLIGLRGDRARHPRDDRVRRLSRLRDSLDDVANQYLSNSGRGRR